jgi:hypothetical protein
MDLKWIRYDDVNWINLAKDRDQCWAVANTDMNLRILQKARNVLASTAKISFSRRTLLGGVLVYHLSPISVVACMSRQSRPSWCIHHNSMNLAKQSYKLCIPLFTLSQGFSEVRAEVPFLGGCLRHISRNIWRSFTRSATCSRLMTFRFVLTVRRDWVSWFLGRNNPLYEMKDMKYLRNDN